MEVCRDRTISRKKSLRVSWGFNANLATTDSVG
jgi:hypothetical protein